MDKELILKKSASFPHVFRLLPLSEGKPSEPGTWVQYPFDTALNFWVNSSHPEANVFFNEQMQLIEGYKMTTDLITKENNELMASAGTSIEQSRAVAETQAAMLVAKKFPRDENLACDKIINACQRVGLAESGMYAYKRGTSLITGVSIRLAEVMAKYWGNITYGFREIGRTSISSEIEVFCWDMENNVRATRVFTVKHWRDTTGGGYALKTERDIYELIANQAQRRVRACILEMIPGDIVEDAEKQCTKTLAGETGKPIDERVSDMIAAFKELKVTKDDIETFLNHKSTAIVPAELVRLQQIYKSIKDGVAPKEDFFKPGDKKEKPAPKKPAKKEPEPSNEPAKAKGTEIDLTTAQKQVIAAAKKFQAEANQAKAELEFTVSYAEFTDSMAKRFFKRLNKILDSVE